MNKIRDNAARVRRLEDRQNNKPNYGLTVDWDNTPDSELEPGTLVIEWGPNDQIISHRVQAGNRLQSGTAAKKTPI